MPPSPQNKAASKGRLYLLGGYDGASRLDDVWVYDLDLYTWTDLRVDNGEEWGEGRGKPAGRSR